MKRPVTVGVVLGLLVVLLWSASPVGAQAPEVPSSPLILAPGGFGTATGDLAHPAIAPGFPFSTGMAASVALGAPSLATVYSGTINASHFGGAPEYATTDQQGDVWVTDFAGNRALEFRAPFTTGEAASVVIGQRSFTGALPGTSAANLTNPGAAAVDSHGDLWVADFGNNRVLEFVPPFTDGMSATLVLGQSSFTGNVGGTTAVNLTFPVGMAFDPHGDLWLADDGNNRILEFTPPFSKGMAASLVLGQSTFAGNQPGLSATNLSAPIDVAATQNTVWVADQSNDRVVGYTAPFSNGETATLLLGQTSFTTTGATGAAAMGSTLSVSVDPHGDLWVSDTGHNRVLAFTPPFPTFEAPLVALGQSTLTGNQPGLSAVNESFPFGAEVAPSGALWVTDEMNSRLLEYVPTVYPLTVNEVGLPAGTPWSATVDTTPVSGVGSFHFSVTNGTHTLNVPPVAGYRPSPAFSTFPVNGGPVTETVTFSAAPPNPFSPGMAATLVIGQINFTSNSVATFNAANASAFTGHDNYAAIFDTKGDLWVADADGNRILEFLPPFSNGMAASLVLGETNFVGTISGISATNLSFPDGLAFAPNGDLWVSDAGNNRVVAFAPPFSDGEAASLVLGQSTFTGRLAGHSAVNLSDPAELTYYNNALWVAEYGNNRVVEYPAPFSTGEAVTLVLGQAGLGGFLSATTAVNESSPGAIAFDAKGDAWVADDGNSRALEYPAPLSTGEAATVVLGQPSFTVSNSVYPQSFSDDNGIWMDAHGNLWVADSSDNRVLEFSGPTFVTNETPSLVVGQGNLSTFGGATTRTGEYYPTLALTDSNGDLWVVDADNARVLEYAPTTYTLKFTETGLPSGTSWAVSVNGTLHGSSSSTVSLSAKNGTYAWNTSLAGWISSNGNVAVNGANVSVAVTFVPFTYAVTFTESGLPSGTSWSVTFGGSTLSATAPASISFTSPNGSTSYSVGSVSGYTASPSSSSVLVKGGPQSVTVTFSKTSSSGGSFPGGLTGLILIVVVVVVVAALAALLLMRRRRKGPTAGGPQAWTPPAGSPPPGAAPPGATSPPPAPGTPPAGPPPGAM
jgi:sugar lactone lactonase YvrE